MDIRHLILFAILIVESLQQTCRYAFKYVESVNTMYNAQIPSRSVCPKCLSFDPVSKIVSFQDCDPHNTKQRFNIHKTKDALLKYIQATTNNEIIFNYLCNSVWNLNQEFEFYPSSDTGGTAIKAGGQNLCLTQTPYMVYSQCSQLFTPCTSLTNGGVTTKLQSFFLINNNYLFPVFKVRGLLINYESRVTLNPVNYIVPNTLQYFNQTFTQYFNTTTYPPYTIGPFDTGYVFGRLEIGKYLLLVDVIDNVNYYFKITNTYLTITMCREDFDYGFLLPIRFLRTYGNYDPIRNDYMKSNLLISARVAIKLTGIGLYCGGPMVFDLNGQYITRSPCWSCNGSNQQVVSMPIYMPAGQQLYFMVHGCTLGQQNNWNNRGPGWSDGYIYVGPMLQLNNDGTIWTGEYSSCFLWWCNYYYWNNSNDWAGQVTYFLDTP